MDDYQKKQQEYLDNIRRREEEYLEDIRKREELEMRRQQDRRRQGQNSPLKNAIKDTLKREAKQLGKQAIKQVGTKIAASAAWSALSGAVVAALPVIGIILLILSVIFLAIYMICNPEGLLALLAAYGAELTGTVPQEVCDALSGAGAGVASVVESGVGAMCSSSSLLAQQNNTPYPRRNDPDLERLIACINGQVPSPGSVFTFDLQADACNYTRGAETCGQCSHSPESCHYGGALGRSGSLAVDFSGSPGAGNEAVIGPQILQAAISCSESLGIPLKRSTCENDQGASVACADPGANHTHTSLGECDKDTGPINQQ